MKEIVVIGDSELGCGSYTDDFISDNTLATFLGELAQKNHEVLVVFNGDTFDFLKCPYIVAGNHTYPRHITPEISLAKLELIRKAHYKVFEAISLLIKKGKSVHFIIGNHDADIAFSKVQNRICQIVGGECSFSFELETVNVHIEHGHLREKLHLMDPKKTFDIWRCKKILRMPWVSYAAMNALDLKEKYPMSERIFSRKHVPLYNRKLNTKLVNSFLSYFFKSALYYRWRYINDPTYRFARELLLEPINQLLNIGSRWDIPHLFDLFGEHPSKLIVIGHAHKVMVEKKYNKTLVHPGSWRDEYDLDDTRMKLFARPKFYVKIICKDGKFDWSLERIQVERQALDYYQVVLNEHKFVKRVAKEEGFKGLIV